MSNITCPSCGGQKFTQINDREYRCEYCGHIFFPNSQSMSSLSKSLGRTDSNSVRIHGYTQWYAITPKVDVLCENQVIASVAHNEVTTVYLACRCSLTFKCGIRDTTLFVTPGIDTDLYISFDRITGELLVTNSAERKSVNDKNRTTAAILAFLCGGLGVHQFYLGNTGKGVLYLVFCWTYIPTIIGFVDGIMLITQSDEDFDVKPKLLL